MTVSFFEIDDREMLYQQPPDVLAAEWEDYIERQNDAHVYGSIAEAPVQLDLELNGSCNMACPFCLHGYGEGRRDGWVESADAMQLITEAAKLGVRSLKLNYINEPLLRQDLEDFIRHAKKEGILNVYFVTNALLLTRERARSLIFSGLTKLFVSLDAVTSETYDKQRKKGCYDKVERNIINFLEERKKIGAVWPLLRVSFLENQINIHEKDAFRAKWSGLADIVAFQRMNEVPGRITGLRLSLDSVTEKCSFPNKQLVVDSEGDILPCCKLEGKNLALGNISSTTLEQAWNSEKMKRIRNAHAQGKYHEVNPCRRCMSG